MRTPLSSVPTYSWSRFDWRRMEGTANASDLGIPRGASPGSRAYLDAADVAICIRGERETKAFFLVEESNASWIFLSPDGFTAVIFND